MRITLSEPVRAGLISLAAILMITCLVVGSASAQSVFARREQVIYEGDPLDPSTIKLGSWGNGMAEESSQNAFIGSRSLKITPKDLYAGGRIDYLVPLDLTPSFKADDIYLQFVTLFAGMQTQTDQFAFTSQSATDIYGQSYTIGRQVRRVRLVVFLENGPTVECLTDVASYRLSDDGWMVVSYPIAALKGKTDLAQYRVKRLVITGDGNEAFHIGEIRTMRDTTPLSADAGSDKEVSKNYSIAFQGTATAGASAVKYSWDFDKSNGVQEEAVSDLVYHRFTKAGDYEATLTVTDAFGIKKPATATIKVKVNE